MQSSWDTFADLESALAGTRGNTQHALRLVQQNLIVGESVEWVSTASVNDFGNWDDGVVVVTDERVIVSYVNSAVEMTYAQTVVRYPIPRIIQFQGEGHLSSFQIEGIPLQAVALPNATLERFRELLDSTPTPESTTTLQAGQSNDPVETLSKLKSLLDMDLITEEEYEAKKAEILSRM